MADHLTFANLMAELKRIIKAPKGSKDDLIKQVINQVYLNEIMVCDEAIPFYWMIDMDDELESVAPATITDINQADPGTITTEDDHNLVVGDLVTLHNIGGMTELNDRLRRVNTVPSDTELTFGVNTSGFSAYTSGGTIHHRGKTFTTRVQKLIVAGWHEKKPMKAMSLQEIEEDYTMAHYTDKLLDPPTNYYHGKGYDSTGHEVNQIIWHPGAETNRILRYWYEIRPSRLTDNNHTPMLPPVFHHMILAGAATRLAEYNVQVENAVIWPKLYAQQLEALKSFNRQFYEQKEVMECYLMR